jgi:hypothetical protein
MITTCPICDGVMTICHQNYVCTVCGFSMAISGPNTTEPDPERDENDFDRWYRSQKESRGAVAAGGC